MARNVKNGVPYISLDCNFFDKPKMFKIEERFGEVGTVRALRLLLLVYSGEGCWLEWGDGAAYYFAKKVLGNAGAAEEVEELVRFLVEIGFFALVEGTEGDEIGRAFLTSAEILTDWAKIQKQAKRKIDFDRIPRCIWAAANAPLTVTPQIEQTSEGKRITSEEKAITSGVMQQSKVNNNKQTNKQTKKIPEGIVPEVLPPPAAEAGTPPDFMAEAKADPRWEEVRLRIARMIYSPGLSADLVDWFAAVGLRKWIKPDQVQKWRREARYEAELFEESKGRAGKAKRWEVLRPKLEKVLGAHGMELPPCDPHRREPPPVPEDAGSMDPATAAGLTV